MLTAMLVFVRIASLLAGLPVFTARGVPRHVSVLLAVAITILIVGSMPPVTEEVTLPLLVLGLGSEAVLGFLLAVAVRFVFATFTVAAELMDRQMALGMSSFGDPILQMNQSPIGILGSWLAGLSFLGLGLHHRFLEGIAFSFHRVPAGALTDLTPLAGHLVEVGGLTIRLGFQLAGPLFALTFLVNVFIGVLSRLAPKMNVFFSVGLTLNSAVGLVILSLSMPWMLTVHGEAMVGALERFATMIAAVGP